MFLVYLRELGSEQVIHFIVFAVNKNFGILVLVGLLLFTS